MVSFSSLSLLLRSSLGLGGIVNNDQAIISDANPSFTVARDWAVLGPFQLGTRGEDTSTIDYKKLCLTSIEIAWGADPLELYGGFHTLEHDPDATFLTPLAFNGTTCWSTQEAILRYESNEATSAELTVSFPEVEWPWLRDTYGWAAIQWQGWARGGIFIEDEDFDVLILSTDQVLEYWIDDVHYYGGDFYGYRKAPVTLRLEKGAHRFDVKLVREIRSMGAADEPKLTINFELRRSRAALVRTNPEFDQGVLISDVIGDDFGPIASPYASVTVRNDADRDIYIHRMRGMPTTCILELISDRPIRLVPGQTRPIGFEVGCVPSYQRRIEAHLLYRIDGDDTEHLMYLGVWPDVRVSMREPHKVTYLAPGGIVSYTILRPPSEKAQCGDRKDEALPIMIALHGAGLEADSDIVKNALSELPDLCAWVLFPTGVTPWSGDDWHVWGLADVEAAIAAIPKWIEQVEWRGPGVDVNRWLVSGHSNGGQGTWYILTHRPDKVIAAAAVSGYSSIQNYVPYVWWQTADPGREAVVQSTLLNYRHELLLENAKDIPVLQQHGSNDDNVPVYNSRLLAQRIHQAGANSTFFEVPGKPHYWDGVMTTQPLRDFYQHHLDNQDAATAKSVLPPNDFTLVVANAGEMGSKKGVQVVKLSVPGKLAKVQFTFESHTGTCVFWTINVVSWSMATSYHNHCQRLVVDGQIPDLVNTAQPTVLTRSPSIGRWETSTASAASSAGHQRRSHQLGGMDAILRSHGHFSIVKHSKETDHIALQISRNLCQYYAADTDIAANYTTALNTTGNIISIAIGEDLPQEIDDQQSIWVTHDGIIIDYNGENYGWSAWQSKGLAAIFLRPLAGKRLELVVWGVNAKALETSARLVPLLTGGGQPDFIIMDQTMLWKGLEGTLGLGFFDWDWQVSQNSYLSV